MTQIRRHSVLILLSSWRVIGTERQDRFHYFSYNKPRPQQWRVASFDIMYSHKTQYTLKVTVLSFIFVDRYVENS